jgi:DNA polymerase-3 subunit delta'
VSREVAGLAEATRHQPGARAALTAALERPSHAYLFTGPRGSGKRAAARAFAAEVLASASPEPDETRRRALLDPSPHPDLVWLRPPGTQHLVEEVRERVISQTAYRPFEGGRRAFVIEAAESLADESQNALLKTLEEPPEFTHLVLVSSEPGALLETVVSRCRPVQFMPLPVEVIEEQLRAGGSGVESEWRAAARLCGGDADVAAYLLTDAGRKLRAGVESCLRAARGGRVGEGPWRVLLEGAEHAGAEAAERTEEAVLADAEASGDPKAKSRGRRDAAEAAKRAGRRQRTESLDLGLALCGMWARDLAAVAEGLPELAYNVDRVDELSADAGGLDPVAARKAGERILDTRARLRVNVSEELALESLFYRLEDLLS